MKKILLLLIVLMLLHTTQTFAETQDYIPLKSESVILIDATTGEILYDKYGDHSMYPASITKIVTAIVAIEEGNLNDYVTVSENARNVAGTRVYLKIGERVKLKKLIQGLMINSGNDAAVAIAEYMDGSVGAFAKRMNKFVKEKIGVKNSHFENPHGLYHPKHMTTAEDMAKITQYAMKNKTFRKIVGTKQLRWDGEAWDTILYNHHRLLRQREDVTGVKNGFVNQAGFTLVTSASQKHIDLIAVTLKADSADQAYEDTEKLLEYGFKNYKTYTVKATQPFINVNGEEFVLNEPFNFTDIKNLQWDKNVNKKGDLVIKDQDGNLLFKHKSSPKMNQTVQAAAVAPPNPKPTSSNQFNIWWISLIVFLSLTILIYLINKYKQKRRRFFY